MQVTTDTLGRYDDPQRHDDGVNAGGPRDKPNVMPARTAQASASLPATARHDGRSPRTVERVFKLDQGISGALLDDQYSVIAQIGDGDCIVHCSMPYIVCAL